MTEYYYFWIVVKYKLMVYYYYILIFYIIFYKIKFICLVAFSIFSIFSFVTSTFLYTFNNAILFSRSSLVLFLKYIFSLKKQHRIAFDFLVYSINLPCNL